MKIGVREIEIFRVVMRAGGTSKAATMLGISQPAVSQSIRKLEEGAGIQLFLRLRGRLVPTQEAQALIQDVDQLFIGFEFIEHRLKSLRQRGTDRLRVAAHPAMGISFLPRAIAAYQPDRHGMFISLRVLSSKEVYQQVSSGECDFGLMADEMPVYGLEHSEFLYTPGLIVMSPNHPLAVKSIIEPKDIENIDFLSLNPEDSARRRLEAALQAHGVQVTTRIETPYAHSLCEMALQGLGVAFVQPVAAYDFIDRGLVIRPFSLDVNFKSLLVFRPGNPLGRNAQLMLKTMRIQLEKDLRKLRGVVGAM
ncbi:LysR substrate-binding domain-containing protein [Pseudomonas auratipiscis]|uniref:LysR substrate-binding domain-containing protein n=1 Tax=Pseudomonas auratipiscis TaxID=3115853 RepID=A0AB35WPI6_9PSED|nr:MULTISPECIES: LysR substrate-binding domain-containing protein [unclassified Pseudomonas]MEE1865848.1 LysR substrate-binding domain-containing protein [Pseudomonas sp. 120P]MEE1956983.1 LysR substrate-binding domain-containing protein [Pseudomonas sp. 119P]